MIIFIKYVCDWYYLLNNVIKNVFFFCVYLSFKDAEFVEAFAEGELNVTEYIARS